MQRPPLTQQVTFLYTTDLEASIQFYEHTMELPLWLSQGNCRIYEVAPDALLGICQTGETEAQRVLEDRKRGNVIFTFVTDHVDEWYTFLTDKGVEFEKPPAITEKYQIYNCFLRDPNGYLLEIQRFLDPPTASTSD